MMRTEATRQHYIERATRLCERAVTELATGDNNMVSYSRIADWVINQRTSLARATWRQYRSALICYFNELPEAALAIAKLKAASGDVCQRKTHRTSGQKAKKLSLDDWRRLSVELQHSQRAFSFETRLWLQAALLTGLRPTEWQSANLRATDMGWTLEVVNAKATNGRANGYSRKLIWAS